MRAEAGPDPSRREELEALDEEVDRLPEKYRAPVVLCHLEGRTHAEAARLLNCPVGTVSIRLSRARERLRARLTRRGLAQPGAFMAATLTARAAPAGIPGGLAESTIRVAICRIAGEAAAAGVVRAGVARLTQSEVRSMLHTKLTVAATGLMAFGVIAAGAGLLATGGRPIPADPDPVAAPPPKGEDDRAARTRSSNNLTVLGQAMESFALKNGSRYPAAAIRKDGKPLLSWRVALLPYLGRRALYEKFHLDEPWDSPHNKTLLKEMPADYGPPNPDGKATDSTHYQVFVGRGTLFPGEKGSLIPDILDGTSNTLMIVEAAAPVPWTKPQDLPFDNEDALPKLGGVFEDGFHAVFADGVAVFLSKNIDTRALRSLITTQGGEAVNRDELKVR